MAKRKKEYCRAITKFTFKGKFYEKGSGLYLTADQKKILINSNLIKS